MVGGGGGGDLAGSLIAAVESFSWVESFSCVKLRVGSDVLVAAAGGFEVPMLDGTKFGEDMDDEDGPFPKDGSVAVSFGAGVGN